MPLIRGNNRHQLQMLSLEQLIPCDHPVRLIEAFVDALDLPALGFTIKGQSQEGRPAFESGILLKLYLYGYINRIRSSRRLERECVRNVELWWLLHHQQPCYKTIADFRKNNVKALKNTFRQFNVMCKSWELFEGKTLAVDSSKFRAQNSKKNNFNAKKVKRHLDYIDDKVARYFEQLQLIDEEERKSETALELEAKTDQLNERRKKYEQLQKDLEDLSKEEQWQISTTDEDARALPLHMGIVEIGYNVQSAVDELNKMVVDFDVTNVKDTYALFDIAKSSKDFLEVDTIDALADKGYHTGSEIKKCTEHNITTYISPRDSSIKSKDKAYRKDRFIYNAEEDTYTCPQSMKLRSNGNWYKKNEGKGRQSYRVKVYKLPFHVCNACPVKEQCAGIANLKNSKGRPIERSEYDDYLEANKKRVENNKEYYRKRQALVEHPFGTIKRQWGYDYTLLKGKEKVTADFALIFLGYNMRRAMSILGVAELISRLKGLFCVILALRLVVAAGVGRMKKCC